MVETKTESCGEARPHEPHPFLRVDDVPGHAPRFCAGTEEP